MAKQGANIAFTDLNIDEKAMETVALLNRTVSESKLTIQCGFFLKNAPCCY
jgi:hypothetical protein